MAKTNRQVKERGIRQGEDEALTYTVDFSQWGTGFTTPSAKIYSLNESTKALTEVTDTNMSGSATVDADVVTLPNIFGLTDGVRYRVEVQAVLASDTYEAYFWIEAER